MAGFDPKQYRQQQAQQFSGTPAPAAAPVTPKQEFSAVQAVNKPFQEAGLLTTDVDEIDEQSTLRRVGEDALSLGLAVPNLAATAVDLVVSPIDTGTEVVKGVLQGYTDMLDSRQWRRHPLLNTVNTIANVSLIGAPIKALILRGARTKTMAAARTAAIGVGANSTLVNNVFKPTRVFRNTVAEGARLGSVEPVATHLTKKFEEAGVLPDTASVLGRQVAEESFGSFLKENKSKLDRVEAFMHPLSVLGSKAGLVSTSVAKTIFGETEKSAVGKLYGSDVVKQDVPGFALVEEWASMQVRESGLQDNVTNRTRRIQDWVDSNPEYQALTPLERNKHFAQYAEADLSRQKFSASQKREYVLTKALPATYIEALRSFIDSRPKVDSDGTPLTNGRIIAELEKEYGNDFKMHSMEVRRRMEGNLEGFDRDLLKASIAKLGDPNIPISPRKLTKAEAAFVKDLEGTGYRIGRAPTAKSRISQAADVQGTRFSKEDLVSNRRFLGKVVDNLGLSPNGNVEGYQFFAFRENLTQRLLAHYGTKKNITVRGVQYPAFTMAAVLEKFRRAQQENFAKRIVSPSNYTIAELRYGDLIKFGFDKADAKAIDSMIRNSTVMSPSVVGLIEGFSNLIKTRNNPLSRAYNQFLRVQSDWRFKKNPMFAVQAAIEAYVWSGLAVKRFPAIDEIVTRLSKTPGIKKVIRNSVGEPTMMEQSLVIDTVLSNYNRQLRDAASPELYRGVNEAPIKSMKGGVEGYLEESRFNEKNADHNIWLGAVGFSNVKLATNMSKAIARKYGMTLDEALASRINKDGTKTFANPWLVTEMQDAATGVFGYHGKILNSALLRTVNSIWFPSRFMTKSAIQTTKWLGSLSPATRLAVVNQWVNTAEWLQTPEGEEWKKENRSTFEEVFNYIFAYESIGKTLNSVTKGELFGGNAGLIGGLPFGFIYNIARDLGGIPQDEQINPATGKPFQRKVQKDATSFPSFVRAIENIVVSIVPAMPFYTLSDGELTGSLNRFTREFVRYGMANLAGALDPEKEYEDYKKEIEKSQKKVKPQYTIFDK